MMKKHLSDNKGRCTCPAWKNGTARMVPAYKLETFVAFAQSLRCKTCEKVADRWQSNRGIAGTDVNAKEIEPPTAD